MATKIVTSKGKDVRESKGKDIRVILKDGTEHNLWRFGRHDKDITLMKDGTRVEFPAYTDHSRSSFGFDENTGILAKECCGCHAWFAIAKLLPDGKWDDIYSKEDVHYDQTRFRSHCNVCYYKKLDEKKETVGNKKNASKPDSLQKDENTSRSELIKVTYNVSEDDRQFLKILAAIDKVRVEVVLARLISRERKERALKF